jgi:hypothetical protein
MAEAGARRAFFRRRKSCPFTGPNAPKSSGHREPPGWQLPGRPQCRDGNVYGGEPVGVQPARKACEKRFQRDRYPTSGHCRWALETRDFTGSKVAPAGDRPSGIHHTIRSVIKCGGQWLQSCRCRKARRFDRGFSLGGPGETPGREWPAPLH